MNKFRCGSESINVDKCSTFQGIVSGMFVCSISVQRQLQSNETKKLRINSKVGNIVLVYCAKCALCKKWEMGCPIRSWFLVFDKLFHVTKLLSHLATTYEPPINLTILAFFLVFAL